MSTGVPPDLVDSEAAWQVALASMAGADALAIDVEGDGFHRYPEQVALIQVGLPDGSFHLLDPLALPDIRGLGPILADAAVTKVFHSASYDVRCLDRDFGFAVRGLLDTAIAAQFCGARRTGLMNVLADFLGIQVDKPKHLQRMDWSIRPLPAEALDYAVADIAHLLALKAALAERLAALGRTDWVAEECGRLQRVRHTPPEPPEVAFLGARGARELSDAGRAILRELFVWRDETAVRVGRPPYHVLSNEAMLFLSEHPDTRLEQVRGLARHQTARQRASLAAAIQRGRSAPPVPWPRYGGVNPWTTESRSRLARLKGWRNAEAEALDLDSGVVWPAPHLDQVALAPGMPSEALDKGAWVRSWQWSALGPSLARFRREALGDALG